MGMAQRASFIDPTVGGNPARIPLAPRPRDLTGTVVGLLDNTKEQGEVIVQTLAEALCQDYGVARVCMRRKEHYSKPAAPDLLDALASAVHVAVTAVGG
jgi:hypothetical protein